MKTNTELSLTPPVKKTITTRVVYELDGQKKEKLHTHISTGAHGYEALCIEGSTGGENKTCHLISEGALPVTCPECLVIWHDTQAFSKEDFEPSLQQL